MKLIEGNIGVGLHDPGLGNGTLYMIWKAQKTKKNRYIGIHQN